MQSYIVQKRDSQAKNSQWRLVGSIFKIRIIITMKQSDFKTSIGRKISDLRKLKNISQEELAWRVGKSRNTISNIERGINSAMLETYEEIAAALDVSVTELFTVDSRLHRDKIKRRNIYNLLKILEEQDDKTIAAIIRQVEFMIKFKEMVKKGASSD